MELGFFSEDADICLHLAMAGSASGEDHGIDGSGSFVGSELVMGNCLKKTLFEKNLKKTCGIEHLRVLAAIQMLIWKLFEKRHRFTGISY